MAFISMSVSSYVSHLVSVAVVGAAAGAGAVLLYSKLNKSTPTEELRAQTLTADKPQLRLVKNNKISA